MSTATTPLSRLRLTANLFVMQNRYGNRRDASGRRPESPFVQISLWISRTRKASTAVFGLN